MVFRAVIGCSGCVWGLDTRTRCSGGVLGRAFSSAGGGVGSREKGVCSVEGRQWGGSFLRWGGQFSLGGACHGCAGLTVVALLAACGVTDITLIRAAGFFLIISMLFGVCRVRREGSAHVELSPQFLVTLIALKGLSKGRGGSVGCITDQLSCQVWTTGRGWRRHVFYELALRCATRGNNVPFAYLPCRDLLFTSPFRVVSNGVAKEENTQSPKVEAGHAGMVSGASFWRPRLLIAGGWILPPLIEISVQSYRLGALKQEFRGTTLFYLYPFDSLFNVQGEPGSVGVRDIRNGLGGGVAWGWGDCLGYLSGAPGVWVVVLSDWLVGVGGVLLVCVCFVALSDFYSGGHFRGACCGVSADTTLRARAQRRSNIGLASSLPFVIQELLRVCTASSELVLLVNNPNCVLAGLIAGVGCLVGGKVLGERLPLAVPGFCIGRMKEGNGVLDLHTSSGLLTSYLMGTGIGGEYCLLSSKL
ncbi:hypothetical protein Tco_1042717 [Tanacetum coccineum]|uniref:Uncharacterized protein n=1 Tax=Tanacetum coccineum TaxID=301880 RepID=A0ABQ5GJX4_9ASTR